MAASALAIILAKADICNVMSIALLVNDARQCRAAKCIIPRRRFAEIAGEKIER
jgi:hypothetical protein